MIRNYFFFFLLLHSFSVCAQKPTEPGATDTLFSRLPDVTVVGRNSKTDYQQMPEIVGTNIYAGKKNSLIVLDQVQGNTATNTMRQVLAKVPGIHVWESDPSGIQIGIAARGLSPNRSWEFNVRQNGYDIAADPFGYPEAYYNPPLQAVQRMEVVRGQGSLQYGPQFGGLVNYILKNGSDITRPFEWESRQTLGSNALFSSFNALGGKKEHFHYYAFFDHRNGDGWRENSRYYTNTAYASFTWKPLSRWSITAELMQSQVRSQQPGGLTDLQFASNAQQSLRSRNWFNIVWQTPALLINYQLNSNTLWNTKIFGTLGNRNSVGFLQSITQKDSINPATGNYANRVVHLDSYRNYGLESRIITDYGWGKMKNTLSAGIRLYSGSTLRMAEGKGSTGSDYDLTVMGTFPHDISFQSQNFAAFAEHIFRITDRLLLIPGIRLEALQGVASGRKGYNNDGSEITLQSITKKRNFVLAGLGAEYHLNKFTELYWNVSQAYRPIQFANLQAPPSTDVVDPKLKDGTGYNIDLGYRGKLKNILQFDISVYYLQYNNRVGTIHPTGSTYRLITNVGSSRSKGFEGFAEMNAFRALNVFPHADLNLFCSFSYTDARYSSQHKDASTKGKKVENAPATILRTGITGKYKRAALTFQLNEVGGCFSDANNTLLPSGNGNSGWIPSYTVCDLTASGNLPKGLQLKAGINNLFDARYFTRRAGGYPGPGLLPADGRTVFVSVGLRM